jgi:hypothetical protein
MQTFIDTPNQAVPESNNSEVLSNALDLFRVVCNTPSFYLAQMVVVLDIRSTHLRS